jgi:hypothetical protein
MNRITTLPLSCEPSRRFDGVFTDLILTGTSDVQGR